MRAIHQDLKRVLRMTTATYWITDHNERAIGQMVLPSLIGTVAYGS